LEKAPLAPGGWRGYTLHTNKRSKQMNTYKVKCIYRGLPTETFEAPHSFAARKAYAVKNGCELLDCYAKRVWDEGKAEAAYHLKAELADRSPAPPKSEAFKAFLAKHGAA
jgi:hypothetical protein